MDLGHGVATILTANRGFHPHRLLAHGHFAAFEIPEEMARLIEAFVAA